MKWVHCLILAFHYLAIHSATAFAQQRPLTLEREANWLIIRDGMLADGPIRINYLEAYCRPNSTDQDWHSTTIGHQTELVSLSPDGREMRLKCRVNDGVQVDHVITSDADSVTFQLTAHNPTAVASEAHWAQPCIRLGNFTGYDDAGMDLDDYLPKCFVFLDDRLARMSQIEPWAKDARYTPGQVWCPIHVPRSDVNPRPLSDLVPSNGLIGCFSRDESLVFAVVFEPYQELFQGVARCLHSDFRIGGLQPGEKKQIRGKLYITKNDTAALLKRYRNDFPEHFATQPTVSNVKVPAQPLCQKGELIFSDDFQRSELGEWKVVIPGFYLDRGMMIGRQDRSDHGAVGRVHRAMRDVVVDFRFRLAGSNGLNVVFDDKNHKGSHAGHICRAVFAAKAVRLGDDKEGVMRNDIFQLRKTTEGKKRAEEMLVGRSVSVKTDLDQNQWYRGTIEIVGDRMRVSLDDRPVAYLQSPGIAHPTKESMHFTVSGPGVHFDDVRIWAAKVELDR